MSGTGNSLRNLAVTSSCLAIAPLRLPIPLVRPKLASISEVFCSVAIPSWQEQLVEQVGPVESAARRHQSTRALIKASRVSA